MMVRRFLVANPGWPGLFRGCLAWGLAAEANVCTVADRVWRPSDEVVVTGGRPGTLTPGGGWLAAALRKPLRREWLVELEADSLEGPLAS
jgi:hypothetical protein